MAEALRQNLELKARCPDLAATRQKVIQLCGPAALTLRQVDTFFPVPHGRLKLRAVNGGSAELIAYDRPDRGEVRVSTYRLVPVPDAPALRAALADALGIRGEVRKRREVHFWHNVRIHLDEVEGLGTFLEFEAALSGPDDVALSQERLHYLSEYLAIRPEDHVATSYADLLGI